MKLNEKQIDIIRKALMLYHDYSKPSPVQRFGYLRLCLVETEEFPHGLSLGLAADRENQEEVKEKATRWLVDFIEEILKNR